jgi:hypothetical protein
MNTPRCPYGLHWHVFQIGRWLGSRDEISESTATSGWAQKEEAPVQLGVGRVHRRFGSRRDLRWPQAVSRLIHSRRALLLA